MSNITKIQKEISSHRENANNDISRKYFQTAHINEIELQIDNPYQSYLSADEYLNAKSNSIINAKNINELSLELESKKNQLENLTQNYANFKVITGGSREDYNNDELYFYMLKRETGYDSIEKLEEDLEKLNRDLLSLKLSIYKLTQYEKLIFFDEIKKTDNFKNYINIEKYIYPSTYDELVRDEKAIFGSHNLNLLDKYNCKSLVEFNEMKQLFFMGIEQRRMYNYLNTKELKNEYLHSMLDYTNYLEGKEKATLYVNSLPQNLLSNINLLFKGLSDGLSNFFNGILNLINHDSIRSANDYEKIEILSLLQEKNKSAFTYNVGDVVGNALIPIMLDLASEGLLTPASKSIDAATFTETNANLIGTIIGGTTAGLSEVGNSIEYSLQVGSDLSDAYLYGAFRGAAEAGLEIIGGQITHQMYDAGSAIINIGSEFILENSIEDAISSPVLEKIPVNREELEHSSGIDKVSDVLSNEEI